MKLIKYFLIILLFNSCKEEAKIVKKATTKSTIVLSNTLKINKLIFDIDGDKTNDTIELVKNTINKKSGMRIKFGSNKKVKCFGMGNNILKQDLYNLDWVGVFEKVPKGEIYWNNVSENGDILIEEEIKEKDKVKLKNDAVFIHASESCGGGIIYFDNGEFKWIQQE